MMKLLVLVLLVTAVWIKKDDGEWMRMVIIMDNI